jgi:hypothetical protein
MVECGVQLINGVRTKCVPHFGSVERNADGALVDGSVIGDVGE